VRKKILEEKKGENLCEKIKKSESIPKEQRSEVETEELTGTKEGPARRGSRSESSRERVGENPTRVTSGNKDVAGGNHSLHTHRESDEMNEKGVGLHKKNLQIGTSGLQEVKLTSMSGAEGERDRMELQERRGWASEG